MLIIGLGRVGAYASFTFATMFFTGYHKLPECFQITPSSIPLFGLICSMWILRFETSSFSQSYRFLRHVRCQVHNPSCQLPIWLMRKFFCIDIEYNLGKTIFSIPASHHLSCQKRTEFPFPILTSMPSSISDLILEVSDSLLSK